MDHTKTSEWRVEIAVGNTPVKAVTEEKLFKDREQGGKDDNVRSRLEARRMLFSEEKGSKSAGLKSGARVAPFQDNGSLELTAGTDNMSDEAHEGHRDGDLSLIRRQLVQIENQQSSLLDLLQVTSSNMQRLSFPSFLTKLSSKICCFLMNMTYDIMYT